MKLTTALFPVLAFAAGPLFADDARELPMPDVIKNAGTKVEVVMRYAPPTGPCFPPWSAHVRIIDGVVQLPDLALYRPHIVADVSEGLVAFQKEGKWGACNKKGKVVIAPQFESNFYFHSGLAVVPRDGKYGFIDKTARWIIEPKFDRQFKGDFVDGAVPIRGDFVGGACPMCFGGKCAVIDRKGRFIWEPGLLLQAENLPGGIYIQTADGKKGFLNDKGLLIPKGKPNPNYDKGQ